MSRVLNPRKDERTRSRSRGEKSGNKGCNVGGGGSQAGVSVACECLRAHAGQCLGQRADGSNKVLAFVIMVVLRNRASSGMRSENPATVARSI